MNGVVQIRLADKQVQQQQSLQQLMTHPTGQQVSEHDAEFDNGEIFPAAVSEASDETAVGVVTDADTVTNTAVGRAAAVSSNEVMKAAERLVEGSTPHQKAADIDLAPTAGIAADLEPDNLQHNGGQSVSDIIERAAASVAGQDTAQIPAAALPGHDISRCQPGLQASAQQGFEDMPDGSSAHEQHGREYPWMEPMGHAAVSGVQAQPTSDPGVLQQLHVSFATGAMARGQGSRIPMRYLAAAAADKQEAAEEAAEEAAAAAVAAAVAAADRRRQRQTAAMAAVEGTASETVVQSQNVVVRQAEIDGAAEQGWSQGHAPAEDTESRPMRCFADRLAPSAHPASSTLAEFKRRRDSSQGNDDTGQDQNTARGHRSSLEGSEQADAVSVTSYANSAASGLAHLMRAQQPWSESSSSPDRSSMTGSPDAKDISQLQAEVNSQHNGELQLPQQLLSPDQEAEQRCEGDNQPESHQGQQQLPSAQEQLQLAQHVWDKQQTEPQTEGEHDWQQERQVLIKAGRQQEDMPGLQVPFEVASANAGPITEEHAAGKQLASTAYRSASNNAMYS